MKILFVINSPIVGGAEKHTFELADAMRMFGGRSQIFSMKSGPANPPDGVSLHQPSGTRSIYGRWQDLRHTIATIKPDIIVTVNERPLLIAYFAEKFVANNAALIAVTHSTVLRSRWEQFKQLFYRPIFNSADSVVFISENQKRFWSRKGIKPRHQATILNGIDLNKYAPPVRAQWREETRERLGIQPSEYVCGLSAVMRPEKNHVALVDAIHSLSQQNITAKALLVGDGPMRAAIEERAASLGISHRVVLTGMQQDVRPYLAAFDVGCLCSVSIETLSLSALEIMAMGVPMVMSNIGGASEIIDGKNGRLFTVRDEVGFREALVFFADAEARASAGAAARKTVEAKFDQDTMRQLYFEHFQSMRQQLRD